MHGYISDLHWVMPQCTYSLYTIFIPYLESHNWVNAENPTSIEFPNDFTNFTAMITSNKILDCDV